MGKLKTMYGSGIRSLDDLAGELDGNSQSTYGKLNSEVSKHSSALQDVSSIILLQFQVNGYCLSFFHFFICVKLFSSCITAF